MTENATTQDTEPEVTPELTGELTGELTPEQEDVLEARRDVVDPELGIIVDHYYPPAGGNDPRS